MNNKIKQIIGFGLLVSFGVLGRYLLVSKGLQPFPNFEVVTIATFIGIMFLDVKIAMLIPLIGMVCSDLLLGNHILIGGKINQIVIFTYSGFALLALASIFVGNRIKPYVSSINFRSVFCMAGTGALLVLLYDVWTNFGWWYLMYPHTGEALLTVYTLGIPFMIYHLVSGLFTFVFIGLPVISYFITRHPKLITKKTHNEAWKRSVTAGIVAFILVIISLTGCISTSLEPSESKRIVENVDMKIIAPDWDIAYMNVTTENVTVADFLFECAEHYNFSVKADYWSGYDSLFIKAINGMDNGEDGNYWQYYVNGKFANVGCSRYYLKNNDVVEWRFEKSPF